MNSESCSQNACFGPKSTRNIWTPLTRIFLKKLVFSKKKNFKNTPHPTLFRSGPYSDFGQRGTAPRMKHGMTPMNLVSNASASRFFSALSIGTSISLYLQQKKFQKKTWLRMLRWLFLFLKLFKLKKQAIFLALPYMLLFSCELTLVLVPESIAKELDFS